MERNLSYDEVHERLKPHLEELVDRLGGIEREDPWRVVSDFGKRINYPIGYLELIGHLDAYFSERRESSPRSAPLGNRENGGSQPPSRLDEWRRQFTMHEGGGYRPPSHLNGGGIDQRAGTGGKGFWPSSVSDDHVEPDLYE